MKCSPNDNKQYHSFTLDNGLRVVIVEAEQGHKSACSLVVNAGSFDDPADRAGFAHFVEHLLFNGSKKYPEPNSINQFVSKHGGQCNAWTGVEHSNYFFDIQPEQFHNGLDRFANLFIEPLFSDQAIQKEQEAIHSEYKLKLQDDSRRIQQVHKETCNPAHPYSKFTVGTRETLAYRDGKDLHTELTEFYNQHYQAQYMSLCIVSDESFDEISEVVKRLFGQIKGSDSVKPKIQVPLYDSPHLQQIIFIEPIKELHKLNLTFAFPDVDPFYQNKMVSFIAHLIGHEEPGSLFDVLKSKGLINSLSAGNGISGSNFKDFNISCELTEYGESELELILEEVFTYLSFMKSQVPADYLYIEQKKLSDISFKYQEDIKSSKLANLIAINMQHYPEEDYISGDYRMDGIELKQWHYFLNFLTAKNLRITLVSQSIETNQIAPWYQTPYKVEPIPAEIIAELDALDGRDANYKLPQPNPYLAQEIKLEEADFNSPIPVSIENTLGWNCWFKQDTSFRVPKGNIYLGFDLPIGTANRTNQAMTRLFCDLFMDSVAEQHYQAEMAGLHYNIYAHNAGLTLYTSGLSNNQHKLVMTLINGMLNTEFSEARFNEIKRSLVKHWRNSESNKPISQLFGYLSSSLLPSMGSSIELADELETVNFEQFSNFHKSLFSELYAEALFYGNWTTTQAIAINEQIKAQFVANKKVDELPRNVKSATPNQLTRLDKDIEHNDYAAVLYLQGLSFPRGETDDVIEMAIYILASQILAPFSFNFLRSEKQLGYLAGSGYMPLSNTPGLAIYIQSHDYNSEHLLTEMKSCLQEFIEELTSMSEQEFARHQQAVIHQYQEQPSNLSQKCQQLWVSIGNKDYSFNQKEKIVSALTELTLSQLVCWARASLALEQLTGIELASHKV